MCSVTVLVTRVVRFRAIVLYFLYVGVMVFRGHEGPVTYSEGSYYTRLCYFYKRRVDKAGGTFLHVDYAM